MRHSSEKNDQVRGRHGRSRLLYYALGAKVVLQIDGGTAITVEGTVIS